MRHVQLAREDRRGTDDQEGKYLCKEGGRENNPAAEISGFCHTQANRRGGRGLPRVQRLRETLNIAPGGGGDNFPTRISEKCLVRARGSVWCTRIGAVDCMTAPSTAKPNILTNATSFSSETATMNPMRDRKMAPLRLVYSIYGGGGQGGLALSRGANSEVPEMGHPVWQSGFPSHPLTSSGYPVNWMNTPPKPFSVSW